MYETRRKEALDQLGPNATEAQKEQVYNNLTSQGSSKKKSPPCLELLRDSGFTYILKDDSAEQNLSKYPLIRNVVLRSSEMWEIFKTFMKEYQDANIPHPNVEKCGKVLDAIIDSGKRPLTGEVLVQQLKTHK